MRYTDISVPDLEIDPEIIHKVLVEFIRVQISKTGLEKAVFGLSGGLDSVVVAFILKEALGSGNVLAAVLPYNTVGSESIKDAKNIRDILNLQCIIMDIAPIVNSCRDTLLSSAVGNPDRIRMGNIMARQRMVLLYDLSKAIGGLVIGTSNKTELLLGYGTLHGDLAFAFDPLGDLYKTQIRAYARYLGVPENIIVKSPSADFWPGQTDEQDLGFAYEDLDKLLYLMTDKGLNIQELLDLGFDRDFIDSINKRIYSNAFKARMPLIAGLQKQEIKGDYRYWRSTILPNNRLQIDP
ncbi:MAG: NAD+ synthase [Firmicutes bacterium]|mgnify:CR=1 FL=1|jgi:NAD+ synthase|nr:NAD+ synthase [Bacillota bacterium]